MTTLTLATFVSSLYEDTLPPLHVVPDDVDTKSYFNRTGAVPVTSEDESEQCSGFDNWKTHYEFEAWFAYRQMTDSHKAFQAMVSDVLSKLSWGRDAISIISTVNRRVNANS